MALPVSFFEQTVADNTRKASGLPETGHWRVAITTITAGNLVATVAALGTLATALDALVIGQVQKGVTISGQDIVSAAPASSPLAQRENKWLARYHGTTLNQKFQVSFPTADLTLLANNSEFLDLTADPGLAFKTAFEAIVKSPNDGAEATVLDSMQFVGRNT